MMRALLTSSVTRRLKPALYILIVVLTTAAVGTIGHRFHVAAEDQSASQPGAARDAPARQRGECGDCRCDRIREGD